MPRAQLIACLLLLGCSFDPGGAMTGVDASEVELDSGDNCVEQVYDAFDQFSFDDNPTLDGVWRYGATTGFRGPFALHTEQTVGQQLETWHTPIGPDPNVVKNPTGVVVQHNTAPIDFPADDFLHVHPGPTDQPSMVRWTAPAGGAYLVEAEFISLNTSGATTGVHIVHNDLSVFDDEIMGPADTASFSMTQVLSEGDVVDFAVSDGGNGYISDSTGVQATLTFACGAAGF